jgi:hypothetical protein
MNKEGIENGTVEPNSTFGYIQHWFSAEQFEAMKKYGEKPHKRLFGLLRDKS